MNMFTYGTLKRGFSNEIFLKHSKFIGVAVTKHKYPMINIEISFPCLIDDKGHGKYIKGELYEIDDVTLKMLDVVEDYPDLFTRGNIELVLDGKKIEAIAYFAIDEIEYRSLEMLEEFVQ